MDIFHDLFENIDAVKIEEYVRTNQPENLHLEFKTVNDSALSNKFDKKNLARSLSGFANSQGGIVVWGVYAAPEGSDNRHAVTPYSIDNLNNFEQKLNEMTCQLASPAPSGVRHEALPIENDRGYVKTFVPETESDPVMAKSGEDRYYKRSGDSFMRMEAYEIADMFGRRKRPMLKPMIRACSLMEQGEISRPFLIVALKNEGRGIAKWPYLAVNLSPDHTNDISTLHSKYLEYGLQYLQKFSDDRNECCVSFGAKPDTVIYPGLILDIFRIDGKKLYPNRFIPHLTFRFILAAEDVSAQQSEVHLDAGTLNLGLHKAKSTGVYSFELE